MAFVVNDGDAAIQKIGQIVIIMVVKTHSAIGIADKHIMGMNDALSSSVAMTAQNTTNANRQDFAILLGTFMGVEVFCSRLQNELRCILANYFHLIS